jgi:two-component sensor histidine kinase
MKQIENPSPRPVCPWISTDNGKSLGLQLVSDLARQIPGSLKIGPGPAAAFEVTFSPTRTQAAMEIPSP